MHHWLQNCSGSGVYRSICRIRWTAVTPEVMSQMTDHLWAQESVGAVFSRTVVPFFNRRKRWCDFLRNNHTSWRGLEGDKRARKSYWRGKSTIFADRSCSVVALWISGSVRWQQIRVVWWWHIEVPDLLGGSRSDLPGGGTLKFLIYLVAVNRTCLVVAY